MSRTDAERHVDKFEHEYGAQLLSLASHAALPVVLDAPLVHLLRVNYFLDLAQPLSYAAEAQLLLSPLCTEIDGGLYVIGAEERDVLLQHLVKVHGGARLRDVARLLWEYCERGTPWLARAALTEAQQLSAMNYIDPQSALAWLERAQQQGGGGAIADERWFVAMRTDLAGRAAAIATSEPSKESLRALVELGDALAAIDADPFAALRIAEVAAIDLSSISERIDGPLAWQRLLDRAWAENRMVAVLAALAAEYPDKPALTQAIVEYWIRVSPALQVENGHFEAPPPEWRILERHRTAIERSIRSLCLFMFEERQPQGTPFGMGFLIGKRTILTHRSMVALLPPHMRLGPALLAFAERHVQWPAAFRERLRDPQAVVRRVDDPQAAGLVRVTIETVEIDEPTGACAIAFAADPKRDAELPPPLTFFTTPPSDLAGRKVYTMGYPTATDARADATVIKRILGSASEVLRVQPGEIVKLDGEPRVIAHNCFTLGGNGGAPLIDLETGNVLGLHYAGHYTPGPEGLKSGRAIPLWDLLDRPVLTSTGAFERAAATESPSERADPLASIAEAVCSIESSGQQIGTGFLVGPDLVLTCDHVIANRDALDNGLSGLMCRFRDMRYGKEQRVSGISAERVVVRARDLDVALLRLADAAGRSRGWLRLSSLVPAPGSTIRIVAHPAKHQIEVWSGTQRRVSDAVSLMHFTSDDLSANPAQFASSGAPCVDDDLNVIGMLKSISAPLSVLRGQESDDYDWTEHQGIVAGAIVRRLDNLGVKLGSNEIQETRERETTESRPPPAPQPRGHAILVSPQVSRPDGAQGFSDLLIEALRGAAANQDGVVTLRETYRYVWGGLDLANDLPDVLGPQDIFNFALTSVFKPGLPGKRRALVVAIDHYRNPAIAPLEGTVQRAQQISDLLAKRGSFDVITASGDVTWAAVHIKIRELTDSSAADESILLYFAGHSVRLDNARWPVSDRALLAADSDPLDPMSMIYIGDVYETLRLAAAGASILICDIFDERPTPPQPPRKSKRKKPPAKKSKKTAKKRALKRK
jgi:V8-like Glu-specific endopeptidase